MSRRPDRRRSPRGTTPEGQSVESPPAITDTAMVTDDGVRGTGTGVPHQRCPRCGGWFDRTDDDMLERCTRIAQRGAA